MRTNELQLPLKRAERLGADPEEGLETDGMIISPNGEDEGRKPSLLSGGNTSSAGKAEKLLLASKLKDTVQE